MITHAIMRYTKKGKPRVAEVRSITGDGIGSETHKRAILGRALQQCKWKENEWAVFQKGTVQILNIYADYDSGEIQWDELKVLYIEVWDGAELFMCHHSDLRRSRK